MTDPLRCIVMLERGPCQANPVALEADGHTPRLMQSHELDALDRLYKLERRLGTGRLP
jgi:hypothetical protein